MNIILDFILFYYSITTFISLFICIEAWDFSITYLNYKEWTIKNLICLPFIFGILTILFLAYILVTVFTFLEKIEPILNKKLFK